MEKLKLSKNGQWSLEKTDAPRPTQITSKVKTTSRVKTPYTIKYSHSADTLNKPQKGFAGSINTNTDGSHELTAHGSLADDLPASRNHYFDVYNGPEHIGKHMVTTMHWPDEEKSDAAEWYPAGHIMDDDHNIVGGSSGDTYHDAFNDKLNQLHNNNPQAHPAANHISLFDTDYRDKLQAAFHKENDSNRGDLHYRKALMNDGDRHPIEQQRLDFQSQLRTASGDPKATVEHGIIDDAHGITQHNNPATHFMYSANPKSHDHADLSNGVIDRHLKHGQINEDEEDAEGLPHTIYGGGGHTEEGPRPPKSTMH